MSLQRPSSSDSQSRVLIPIALGPGLRSGQGGSALARELSNQATSLSNAMLFEIKAKKKKKIKYQNFEGNVSIADVFLWPQTPALRPQHWKGPREAPRLLSPLQASLLPRHHREDESAECVECQHADRQARGAQHLFLSFRNHRKQEGGLLNLDCTLEFITPAAFIPAARSHPTATISDFPGLGPDLSNFKAPPPQPTPATAVTTTCTQG